MAYPNQRIGLSVEYLTSSNHTAAGCALHFFMVKEQGRRAGGKPAKRMMALVDRQTFLAEVDTAINRCVSISKIEVMCLYEEHLRPLTGPLTQYDVLLQGSTMLDFIRTIGSVFKPNDPANPCPMYELEENQPLAARVNCKISTVAMDDTFARTQSEEVLRRIREANSREVSSLKDALQRQKDEQLQELVDLHTQNEQLKHTLQQTENLLMESKRSIKEMSQKQVMEQPMSDSKPYMPMPAATPQSPDIGYQAPTTPVTPVPVHNHTPIHGYGVTYSVSPQGGGTSINIYSNGLSPMDIQQQRPTSGNAYPITPGRARSPGSVYPSQPPRMPSPRQGDIHPRYASPPGSRPPSATKPAWRM
eukprot:TRINITY_DN43091_c0_g1_i1.p1 TRINITY_DN43091_c0_g1~~TRINITY_DN43091_c0_g1_i1.p1  ORF type:complete len:371 (+),score=89.15 TRINITY_DN43091_c0_g1_i1:31-1113(+)